MSGGLRAVSGIAATSFMIAGGYGLTHAQSLDQALLGYLAFWIGGFCLFFVMALSFGEAR